jgi:hypothetical protein
LIKTLLLSILLILLASCNSLALSTPASTPRQPGSPAPAATADRLSMFAAGYSYGDSSDDMAVSFLDVINFQATVDEETELLEIVLQMRDIPPTAKLGQFENVVEYSWIILIFLDSSRPAPANRMGDYYIALNTNVVNLSPVSNTGPRTLVPGEPVIVPFNQLFENKALYYPGGSVESIPNVTADPDLDTITITSRVPGITSGAVFSFVTAYNDDTTDRPDNYISPDLAGSSIPLPEEGQSPKSSSFLSGADQTHLIPAGVVRAYPGPAHYEGDVLTFEIHNPDGIPGAEQKAILQLDQGEPFEVAGKWSAFSELILPLAINTSGLTGIHTLQISTSDHAVNESYIFEVLPASQRPAAEKGAVWLDYKIHCCTLHYLSGTAAARDINFIAEHFQNAAEYISTLSGEDITSKLDIYLLDRMLGNGGFGGNGQLLVSYTDRYYGPVVGAVGLETLARHEFSHVVDIFGLAKSGNGINFNYEGLAVFIAGGHYKPEPLAERGAALFDLGYYVPVGQYIEQHELSYLYPALMLTYISETYGTDAVGKFLSADNDVLDGQPGPLDFAIQSTFGISVGEFNDNFRSWLEEHEPGSQLDDLRLTIELQDLRRQYQDTYAPSPVFIFNMLEDKNLTLPEFSPIITREAKSPANVAFELILVNAQKAIVDGNYPMAENLINVLRNILATTGFEDPLAKEYFSITSLLLDQGYDIDTLDIKGSTALAQIMRTGTERQTWQLQKVNGYWEIIP